MKPLYVRKSDYVGLNPVSKIFDVDINDGLYSSKDYITGEVVVGFVGEEIDHAELKARTAAGRSGYFVQCTPNIFIDCYENRHRGICRASCINSVHVEHPLKNKITQQLASLNVGLKIRYDTDLKKYIAKYIALKSIQKDTEFFGHYKPLL